MATIGKDVEELKLECEHVKSGEEKAVYFPRLGPHTRLYLCTFCEEVLYASMMHSLITETKNGYRVRQLL